MKPMILWAAVGACMWALMGWAVVSNAAVIEYEASGHFRDGGAFTVTFETDFDNREHIEPLSAFIEGSGPMETFVYEHNYGTSFTDIFSNHGSGVTYPYQNQVELLISFFWTNPDGGENDRLWLRLFVDRATMSIYSGRQYWRDYGGIRFVDYGMVTSNVVPEPATALMLAFGLIGLASFKR